ncbi:glycosyltransferase [Sphingomonas sp. Leaf21]|uniref:glycosyltransferase n=1 Tax=Sphingomonas sp. Leaf21 TaxID=2876550 RepID=UPI001E453929|nr:glycosyltransferase [Sphingomonas sp. Leaf21]
MDVIAEMISIVARELMLFAAVGLFIGGVDDILVDGLYVLRRLWVGPSSQFQSFALPQPHEPGRLVVFVPAWDEAAVIGDMLATALRRFRHDDYRIYVGLYPNDPATIAAATAVADIDDRVRLVIGPRDGPTTKADCLNALWHALREARQAEEFPVKAIVLHDAEDVVHPDELAVFDSLIEGRAVVQLPVLPLVVPGSRLVSGHYADEFAESHRSPPRRSAMHRNGMLILGVSGLRPK